MLTKHNVDFVGKISHHINNFSCNNNKAKEMQVLESQIDTLGDE